MGLIVLRISCQHRETAQNLTFNCSATTAPSLAATAMRVVLFSPSLAAAPPTTQVVFAKGRSNMSSILHRPACPGSPGGFLAS
jgi:hypothetical protein